MNVDVAMESMKNQTEHLWMNYQVTKVKSYRESKILQIIIYWGDWTQWRIWCLLQIWEGKSFHSEMISHTSVFTSQTISRWIYQGLFVPTMWKTWNIQSYIPMYEPWDVYTGKQFVVNRAMEKAYLDQSTRWAKWKGLCYLVREDWQCQENRTPMP